MHRWKVEGVQRSRVGQKLSDIITLRVVLGILALLVIVPGFNVNSNLYGDTPDLVSSGLAMLTVAYAAVRSHAGVQAQLMSTTGASSKLKHSSARILGVWQPQTLTCSGAGTGMSSWQQQQQHGPVLQAASKAQMLCRGARYRQR